MEVLNASEVFSTLATAAVAVDDARFKIAKFNKLTFRKAISYDFFGQI